MHPSTVYTTSNEKEKMIIVYRDDRMVFTHHRRVYLGGQSGVVLLSVAVGGRGVVINKVYPGLEISIMI